MAPRGSAADQVIQRLAAPCDGVVHARQLRAAGISSAQVRHRIATGSMARIVGDTYRVGPCCAAPTRAMLLRAGLLHAKAGSMLAGTTAATELGAWNRRVGAIEVAVHRTVSCTDPRFAFRKLSHGATPTVLVDGRRVMAPSVLCLHLARSLSCHQLAFVIRALRYERRMTMGALDELLASCTRHAGARTLRAAIALVRSGSAGTRGATEDELLRLLHEAGLPAPLVNVRGAAGVPGDEPDFLFVDARLDVECDGDHHEAAEHARDDRERDQLMQQLGWRVLRIHWRDVWLDPDGVIRRIRSGLADRSCTVSGILVQQRRMSAAVAPTR